MAEALGVAASGIAIAQISAQVGGAVFKLKQLWDEIKDVPDDIADLMEQIDCLDPVLWQTENIVNESNPSALAWDELASKSTTIYCRKALQNLTDMVDELSRQIHTSKKGRRTLSAVKVLLKKDSLKKLEKRLEIAVRMLTFAQQSYLLALTRVQPDIIVQKFAALTNRGNQPESQVISDSITERVGLMASSPLQRQPDKTGIVARPRWQNRTGFDRPSILGRVIVDSHNSSHTILLHAPTWLSWRSWELHSIKANGAWQWYMRSYSVIPFKSKSLLTAMTGSPNEMQQLFDAGLASPYDWAENGWTLLHAVTNWHNFEMVKYLMSIGLHPRERTRYKSYPAQEIATSTSRSGTLSFIEKVVADPAFAQEFLVFSELNLEDDEHEESNAQNMRSECRCQHGFDLECYEKLLPYQCPLHQYTSVRSRISERKSLFFYGAADVVKSLLEPEWSTDPRAVCTACPVIIMAAFRLSRSICQQWYHKRHCLRLNVPHCRCSDMNSWFSFTVEVVKHTPDIHVIGRNFFTPVLKLTALSCVFDFLITFNSYSPKGRSRLNKHYMIVLKAWLEALKQAGVDLNAYGRREHKILTEDGSRGPGQLGNIRYYPIIYLNGNKSYLIGFKYGPEPEDWKVYWDEPTDRFAGEFWKSIESPPLRIPGSWVDDYDSCE
ncbi:hypothetical protein F4677DRAFT_172830 [Hypoxylon crocopeplum]|nr:hypothetical protein F4677DRAFT_172830 [Hypoxylon crocopeplum]